MNYRLIRSPKSRRRAADIGVPFLFLAALVLSYFFYPTALAKFAARIALPFWHAEAAVSDALHSTLFFFQSKQALIAERDRLARELENARGLLLDRELLRAENSSLALQLGRRQKESARIIGTVVAAPPRSPYDTAVIDVGLRDGATEGDLALSGSAVLGVVSRAYARTSIVEFFSTAGRKTLVSIVRGTTAVPAEAVGEGGGAFVAILPKAVEVSVGDPVVMPGFNPDVFAAVISTESTAADSFQRIRFKNPVSIHTVRFLEIMRQAGEE